MELSVFESLALYNPILTGTIPIEIDLPESDLDIICQCSDHDEFARTVTDLYSNKEKFRLRTKAWNGLRSTIATFQSDNFEIEIFGQDCPTKNQSAYKHMVVEHKILKANNSDFKTEIIRLKQAGLKTEPAFAKLLGLAGNPYEELLRAER